MKEQLDEYLRLSILTYRRLAKEEGPLDRLQTREFREIISQMKTLDFKTLDPLSPYLLYYNFVRLQEGLSLLGEIGTPINSVLDIGSGFGAFTLAALMKGAKNCLMLDHNDKALTIGSDLIGRMGYPVKSQKWSYPSPLPKDKFDLVILGHSLFLMEENPYRLVEKAINRLSATGYLLIVESSQEEVNRDFLFLRDEIVRAGNAIHAPCIWRGPCPALEAKAPCYAQREFYKPHLIGEIQRALKINQSSLKMSYLIVNRAGWPTSDELPDYRVISPPLEGHQGKFFYLCGKGGKKALSSRIDEHPKESRAFEYLKRGEMIELKNCLEAKNQFIITKDSSVIVKAAVGKPPNPVE